MLKPIALLLLVSVAPRPAFAGAGACADQVRVVGEPPQGAELHRLIRLIHGVASREHVDAYVLESIADTETRFRLNVLNRDCDRGLFQITTFWAKVFHIDPAYFWDPEIAATAAARIYKYVRTFWRPKYAALAKHPCLRAAGWHRAKLTPEAFAAMTYNFGRLPTELAHADRMSRAVIPASTCAYAVRFDEALARAKVRGRP